METERLILQPFSEEDLDLVLRLYGNREIMRYMPYDVMDKWYEYRGSEHVVSDDGSEDDYYVISYSLTDKGSDASYSKEHSYSGSIDVIIEVKDDIVQSFNITFGKPRWMRSLSKNSYHTEEWSCNLYDYR